MTAIALHLRPVRKTIPIVLVKNSGAEKNNRFRESMKTKQARDAKKANEPPVNPAGVSLSEADRVSLSDADYQPAAAASPQRGCTLPERTPDCTAFARTADDHEAIAEVRITDQILPPPPPPPPGKQTLHWQGTVPPQKWMNCYTKVLTRFAASPELKLEVCFEIPIDREQAPSKAEETRSGLKELGLDDNT